VNDGVLKRVSYPALGLFFLTLRVPDLIFESVVKAIPNSK
jgi:hypothetical protein